MDGARMLQLQQKGYAISANKSGLPCDIYRPISNSNCLTNQIFTNIPFLIFPASSGYKVLGTNGYGKVTWFSIHDLTTTQVGDYIIRQYDNAIYFIASQKALLQPLLIECNKVVSFKRPDAGLNIGPSSGYSGDLQVTEVLILNNINVSMIQGTKGEKADIVLPGDTRMPWYSVFMPFIFGETILVNDIMVDESNGDRYKVSSCELTDLGYRLSVAYGMT